ncbi:hypothetical protein PVJ1_00052 [Psychrobacillus phage PVJ1]|nr:hypothetical protein PVJ1_00052 [Psychrobacillus phage PVJ1]
MGVLFILQFKWTGGMGMPGEGGNSMFRIVENHDKTINENILPRVEALEKEHLVFKQEMSALKTDLIGVQKGQKDLEVTVMKDGKETRDLLKPFADHVLSQAQFGAQSQREITIKRMDIKEKLWTAALGGGIAGILMAIVALFTVFK